MDYRGCIRLLAFPPDVPIAEVELREIRCSDADFRRRKNEYVVL